MVFSKRNDRQCPAQQVHACHHGFCPPVKRLNVNLYDISKPAGTKQTGLTPRKRGPCQIRLAQLVRADRGDCQARQWGSR